ncbi:Dihydrolipoamide acyltransferase component of branched-chain alpha-keto acid dehydrogenase complex [Microbacterium esteraromaticum]|uniref:Dihydrolipoamide acetyltransferase component of pyruvate dehydrogenase complex n=1 Tax=Microbacterium esteraromaticum TaxID=57043 RepID=A0A1R4J8T1_9MICO|nr:dihydrolipoamide acetyltransferase family protein [Microbacterium esteraromaticum]SJN28488.1 Dihydrolipoamide acyltransferase component of branched-chain alpha-keto acid dehydrogenase complex [Microbacterium esteraromaticum]
MTTATAQQFRLPDLGEGLTEAGLVQWLVQVGDTIATDQAIAEVETAKSVVELPSPFAGVVTALHGEPGETIAVGAVVLEVSANDAAPSHTATPSQAEKEAYRAEERAGSGNVLIGYGTSERAGSGRRRPRAASPASPPSAPDAVERTASARSQAVHSTTSGALDDSSARRPVAVRSPLVRRLARELGVDVQTVTGSGADGAITRGDVLRAAVDHAVDGAATPTASDQPASAVSSTEIDGLAVRCREKLSPLRKAVSAKLSRSRAEIPEATVWVDVDATRLWDARAEMASDGEKAPSLTALVARFAVIALGDFPLLASRLSDDASELISFDGVNLGVAADTERGLLVPVIPNAHTLSVAEFDRSLRDLAETARSGTMPPERLRGSTFTLNNYGGFGVDGSAAIINHPDVAILGIGRMMERPWVVDGEIVARRIAQLSLVFDHRVCDGGYAAGFLRRVVELIEHPLRAYGRI